MLLCEKTQYPDIQKRAEHQDGCTTQKRHDIIYLHIYVHYDSLMYPINGVLCVLRVVFAANPSIVDVSLQQQQHSTPACVSENQGIIRVNSRRFSCFYFFCMILLTEYSSTCNIGRLYINVLVLM